MSKVRTIKVIQSTSTVKKIKVHFCKSKVTDIKVWTPAYQLAPRIRVQLIDAPRRKKTYQIVCKVCESLAEVKCSGTLCCSRSCAATYSERQKGTNPKISVPCSQCEKIVVSYDPPSMKGRRLRFCGRVCQQQYAREHPPTTDLKKQRHNGYQRKYMAKYSQTESGKAKIAESHHRTYLRKKAAKQQGNEQGKIN